MFRIFDSFQLAFERLWNHRVLVIWALVGLMAATTLALSLPLYVDAVNTRLLTSRLPDPPYAFRFRYLGQWKGNIKLDDVNSATAVIHDGFRSQINLPIKQQVSYVGGDAWTTRLDPNKSLGPFSIGSLQGAESQILITAGKWPPTPAQTPAKVGDIIPVMIPEKMMNTMGVQVGNTLTSTPPGGTPLKLKIVAMWKPINANDPSWIFTPKFFDEIFLVQPEAMPLVFNNLTKPVSQSAWYTVFDGSSIRTSDVDGLLTRIIDGQRDVETVLPGIRMEVSPVEGLTAFSKDVNQLTQQLFVMLMPVAGLVLYFVTMIAGLLVNRQQQEDVTLRSRGMSRQGVLWIHVLMWFILATTAFIIGLVTAPAVVTLVGKTTSFLRFDNTDDLLQITFTTQALAAGAITALLAASSGLYIAWQTTRQTITSFKVQSARASTAWWQRAYLDILLLIPAYYTLYSLSRQGGLVSSAEDPFSNPLSFLGPTLFALGNTLLFLRLWPFVLRIGERILAVGKSVALLMALRELTRSIGRYRGGLLMMCFTLSLTGFTASMASTIDRSLVDSVNYKIGADAVLVTVADTQTQAGATDTNTGQTTQNVTGYNTLPVEDLLAVPGVDQASRVGRYDAQINLPSQRIDGVILGIDRGSLASIAHFRSDYANVPLSDLLNQLAGRREGVLISAATAKKYNLKIGQEISYQVNALNAWYQAKVPIVGFINYFPTLNPNGDKFFLIGNIEPIWELVGTELPHDIWISLKPGTDPEAIRQAVIEKGFPVVDWLNPAEALHEAQTAPSRRGVLGFLSVGFIASILLTLVGVIIQSAASFRIQSVQLGTLRAMGLGSLPVAVYLIVSQGLAVAGGILGGTAIGALATILYLPLLDFSGGLPPYLVRVAWDQIFAVYLIFAAILFSVTLLTTFILSRERLFTVVKLGEAA